MQELRDAVAETKQRDAAAAAHAAAVGANRENYWAVSGDGDIAAKPAPTPDAGREDGLDEDGYLVVDERKNARCRPRVCPANACTRHPAAIPAHPCDAARLAPYGTLPPPPDAAPLLRCRCCRYRHSYSQLSSFAESVAVAGNAVSNAVHKLVPAKKDK